MAEVNTGVTTLPADQTFQTPGGQVTISFSGLPTTPTKIIEGNISMDIGPSGSPFVSISGFFYVEQFTDGRTGLTDTVIAATGVTATLAVGDTSLVVAGGNLAIVLDPSHSVTDSFAISFRPRHRLP